jgi:hypothetical protein
MIDIRRVLHPEGTVNVVMEDAAVALEVYLGFLSI